MLDADVCGRALASRDARFDGVFFVGIRTTMIYCRPICPARVSRPERRRFFESAAAAEHDGFRPCLRCRPELAPGRAPVDAVPRVARAAAARIAAGALNGRGVDALARELGVGERQLRRAMEREFGVSPLELAQSHRLLLAKRLLTDTALPVTRIAFASGFQSLRRFNTLFHERYRMSPSALRRRPRVGSRAPAAADDVVRLTLPYRAPLAWALTLRRLRADAVSGVELVEDGRYRRTVGLADCRGFITVEDAAPDPHLTVELSASLLPVLMPLLSRLRHCCDLDAEPAVIDAHLRAAGLARSVERHPGLRMPGAFDGFETAVRELLGRTPDGRDQAAGLAARLGEPVESPDGAPAWTWPDATRVAEAGLAALTEAGIARPTGEAIMAVSMALRDGRMGLEPGADVEETLGRLVGIPGIDEGKAIAIVRQALHWPDGFSSPDRVLRRAAERWRPWRSYAAEHLAVEGLPEEAGLPTSSGWPADRDGRRRGAAPAG